MRRTERSDERKAMVPIYEQELAICGIIHAEMAGGCDLIFAVPRTSISVGNRAGCNLPDLDMMVILLGDDG